jgi:UDP-glucose 4-epimerase
MTTYIVTGGAGFIGSHIAERLLKEGHSVRIVDNLLTGKQEHLEHLKALNADLSIHTASITDFESLHPIFQGAEVVFHQAALASVPRSVEDPLLTHAHCVTGTLHVLKAAQETGVRRVVYAASSSAYGDQEGDFKTESMIPEPISPYGAAKLAAEYYCKVFYHVYGLETVALRYFNVFGARQDPQSEYAAVIPRFITRILQGQAPIIFGDGQQSRDFTYIDNIVHGNLLAASAPEAAGQMMNLAMGGNVSLLQLVEKINAILGTNIPAKHEAARAGDILHSQAAIDKATELLDFSPIVSFDEGLRRTVEWYKEASMV